MGRGLLLRRYLTSRGHLSRRTPRSSPTNAVLATLSGCCPPPKGRLSTCYSPVRRFTQEPKLPFSLDLHVLGLPLTFALSQDQTLHLYFVDDVSSDFIPTRSALPEGEAQPSRGLPVGIKPITLLAIQFSKTDVLACASGVYYRLLSDVSTPVQPSAFGVSSGATGPRGSRFLPCPPRKGRSFCDFFRLSSRAVTTFPGRLGGPGKF